MSGTDRLREVCFLVGAEGEVLWSDQGTTHALPDSRERWEAIWSNRSRLTEIAHSHPAGPLSFSAEDRTTMLAVWAALDTEVAFSVITPAAMIRIRRGGDVEQVTQEPCWVSQLRTASGIERRI